MREVDNTTTKRNSGIQCLEVLISRSNIVKSSDNLFWTLSAYSLENQPVKKDRELHNSEIFHFMAYDWNRTIRRLLEERQVPFSIIQFFCPDTIYSDSLEDFNTPDTEVMFLNAVQRLPENSGGSASALTLERNADTRL